MSQNIKMLPLHLTHSPKTLNKTCKKLGYTRDDKQSLGNGTDDFHKDR